MSVLWMNIEFCKGKSNSKAIIIAARGPSQSPGGVSEGAMPHNFLAL